MTSSPHSWNIRFGQIFHRQLLAQGGQDAASRFFEDFFYITPTGEPPASIAGDLSVAQDRRLSLDLKANRHLYRKHFAEKELPANRTIGRDFAVEFPFTLILVPSIGHEQIAHTHPFEDFFPFDQFGFDVRYASFPTPPGETLATYAKNLAQTILTWENLKENIFLISHHLGVRVILEMIDAPEFAALKPKTKGVLSLAGMLQDPLEMPMDPLFLDNLILFFSHFCGKTAKTIDAKTIAFLKQQVFAEPSWGPSLQRMILDIAEQSSDLVALPPHLNDFLLGNRTLRLSPVAKPTLPFFSIASMLPYGEIWKSSRIPRPIERLFCVLTGMQVGLHKDVLNNGLTPLAWQQFPAGTEHAQHLGTFGTDFFGLAYANFFQRTQGNLFPRKVLYESILILMDEFFN